MNFDQGVFTVVVGVATARPPRVHAHVFVHVAAANASEAQEVAAQVAACHPHVVMPVSTEVVAMVA